MILCLNLVFCVCCLRNETTAGTFQDYKMRLLTCLTAFALVGLLAATPVANEDDVVKCSKLPVNFVKYTAEHDIVKITFPLNALNHATEADNLLRFYYSLPIDRLLFFVEADIQADGSRVDQGLYVFRDGKAKKILDNGRDAAAPADITSNKVFFGAKDGLYVYNYETNSADKYGPITDSIIAIEKEAAGDVIYILTEGREVFKVTDNGEKKEKLADVVNAKEIVLDYENNLYFYADDKKLYVRTTDGIKIIAGLPASTGNVCLFKPPFILENGAPVLVNNEVYLMFPNGTSQNTGLGYKTDVVPTAIALEGAVTQYYAFNKEIYEFNIFSGAVEERLEELGDFLWMQGVTVYATASKNSPLKRKLKTKA